jgi:hypothetical protein
MVQLILQHFTKQSSLLCNGNMVAKIYNDDFKDMERWCIKYPNTTYVLTHLGDSLQNVKARIGLSTLYPNLLL